MTKELSIFEKGLRKSEIFLMAISAFESIEKSGNWLQAAESLSAMENFIKELKGNESFKKYVREEIAKYKGGYISASGARIELAETGVEYDYSKCGDVELEMREQALLSAKNFLNERKEFLKKVPLRGIETIVPYTGEVITIYPPTKTSTSSFKTTLAK